MSVLILVTAAAIVFYYILNFDNLSIPASLWLAEGNNKTSQLPKIIHQHGANRNPHQ